MIIVFFFIIIRVSTEKFCILKNIKLIKKKVQFNDVDLIGF